MPVNVFVFSSKTCAPCQTMKPVFADLKEEFPDYEWSDIDIHQLPELTASMGVRNIPCMVVMKDEKTVGQHIGTNVAQYYRILRQAK